MGAPNARLVGWSTPWAHWAWLFELPRATPITPSPPRRAHARQTEPRAQLECKWKWKWEPVRGGRRSGPPSAIHQSRKRPIQIHTNPPSPSQFALIASLAEAHWKFVFPQPTQTGTYCSATLPSTSCLVSPQVASPHPISQPANSQPSNLAPLDWNFSCRATQVPASSPERANSRLSEMGTGAPSFASPDCQSNVLTT